MKNWTYILFLTLFSCNSLQQKSTNSNSGSQTVSASNQINGGKEICWEGTLNGKTPLFIHYQLDSTVIIGEITYLNTKDKLPITLLGTIEEDKTYRLLEFDTKGNITGVIEGKSTGKEFTGFWISPISDKQFSLKLTLRDSLIASPNIKANNSQIFGSYHYQYGEKGYNGDFDISKVGNNTIDFAIESLTNVERGPNIAEVEKDTISMIGNSFIYKIPGSDSCEFKVVFYTGFVYINYTKGYCESQFGNGATIDGIYLKTK